MNQEQTGVRHTSDLASSGQPSAHQHAITAPAVLARGRRMTSVAGRTEPGFLRALRDERYMIADLDRYSVIRPRRSKAGENAGWASEPPGKLLAVADGLSGASKVAGTATIDQILSYITSAMPWIFEPEGAEGCVSREQIFEDLRHVLSRCERRLRRLAEKRGITSFAGSAITLAYIMWPDMYVAHAGGGRCYLLRDHELHRIGAERPGSMSSRATWARTGARAAPGAHDVDVHHVALRPGDRILLCTSSLVRHVDEREIARCLDTELPSAVVCDHLIGTARQAGADSITAVVCRCG